MNTKNLFLTILLASVISVPAYAAKDIVDVLVSIGTWPADVVLNTSPKKVANRILGTKISHIPGFYMLFNRDGAISRKIYPANYFVASAAIVGSTAYLLTRKKVQEKIKHQSKKIKSMFSNK